MEPTSSLISAIAAVGKRTRAIGFENRLLWKLEGDLPRFKRITDGHPVIMGRHTWLSLNERALPGRTNIVLTKAPWFAPPGVYRAESLDQALEIAQRSPGSDEIFIIGGGRVYADALPYIKRLYVTEVEDDTPGDTFFPAYADQFTKVIEEEAHPEHDPPFVYRTLER